MKKEKEPLLFRLTYKTIKLFYPRYKVECLEPLSDDGNIYISNHAQLHGPLGNYFYFPKKRYIWVIGQMCNRKEVTPYAMEDFWRFKSKYVKWIYYLASTLILAPFGSYLFRKAKTIPVYKDGRLRHTLKISFEKLKDGHNIIIFPESRNPYNDFINDFQVHFVDLAKQYYKMTGKELLFYPMYTCYELRKIIIGRPIRFNSNNKIEDERQRIISYLKESITELGMSLPRHTIIPYVNTKKKYRKKSK